jgi:hypothetical protein
VDAADGSSELMGPSGRIFRQTARFRPGSLISFSCNIWAGLSTSFESLHASRVVAALGGSRTEALDAAIISVSGHLEFPHSPLRLYSNQGFIGYLLSS